MGAGASSGGAAANVSRQAEQPSSSASAPARVTRDDTHAEYVQSVWANASRPEILAEIRRLEGLLETAKVEIKYFEKETRTLKDDRDRLAKEQEAAKLSLALKDSSLTLKARAEQAPEAFLHNLAIPPTDGALRRRLPRSLRVQTSNELKELRLYFSRSTWEGDLSHAAVEAVDSLVFSALRVQCQRVGWTLSIVESRSCARHLPDGKIVDGNDHSLLPSGRTGFLDDLSFFHILLRDFEDMLSCNAALFLCFGMDTSQRLLREGFLTRNKSEVCAHLLSSLSSEYVGPFGLLTESFVRCRRTSSILWRHRDGTENQKAMPWPRQSTE